MRRLISSRSAGRHARPWRSVTERTCWTSGRAQELLACEMAAEVGSVGSVDGIDPSESMIALARGRRPSEGAGEIRFVAGDACALPFGEGTFDAVVATQVYEYVRDMPAALGEAFRVLRPGGRLLVPTPTGGRSCGIHATPSACGTCWPLGKSTSSTRISPGG